VLPWSTSDLQFGDVANALRLTPERTLADFGRSSVALDATTVKAFLTAHPSGLFALCAPDSPAEADGVKPETLATRDRTCKARDVRVCRHRHGGGP